MVFATPPISAVTITSPFWSRIQQNTLKTTLPAIIRAQKDHNHWTCLTWKPGHPIQPHQFWDSDIYKICEAVCYFLMKFPDAALQADVEDAVDMICNAQHDDGYINSYYTVRGLDRRWTNLRDDHELYCLGHLLEFVVAYETLTKNGRMLEVARKVCIQLDMVAKNGGYPGHQEVEIGLIRLHELTGDVEPLKLAERFVLERGRKDADGEIYFDREARLRGGDPYAMMGSEHKAWYPEPRAYWYHQADEQLVDTTEVKGHSVRAMYYYTAATDLKRISGLELPMEKLWRDMVDKKMYVTGGLGSVRQWEGFGPAYLLPDLEDEGCYAETCATFAMIGWANRMLRMHLRSEYADVTEVALYNGFLGAVNQDGDAFYYQNVLRTVEPKERSRWFGVACCPPNVAKLLGSLSELIYSVDGDLVAIHQFIGSEFTVGHVVIKQVTELPLEGRVVIKTSAEIDLAVRIPSWAETWSSSIQGEVRDGYLRVRVKDELVLDFELKAQAVYAHPNLGKDEICLKRGPLIYCLEDVDNDIDVDHLKMVEGSVLEGEWKNICGQRIKTIQARVMQMQPSHQSGLYGKQPWNYDTSLKTVTAIPFFLRANRGGQGKMRVWTPRVRIES